MASIARAAQTADRALARPRRRSLLCGAQVFLVSGRVMVVMAGTESEVNRAIEFVGQNVVGWLD
jgi:hypothetical protein